MITIKCEAIDNDIIWAARLMCKYQKEDVKIMSATETLEVIYEKTVQILCFNFIACIASDATGFLLTD